MSNVELEQILSLQLLVKPNTHTRKQAIENLVLFIYLFACFGGARVSSPMLGPAVWEATLGNEQAAAAVQEIVDKLCAIHGYTSQLLDVSLALADCCFPLFAAELCMHTCLPSAHIFSAVCVYWICWFFLLCFLWWVAGLLLWLWLLTFCFPLRSLRYHYFQLLSRSEQLYGLRQQQYFEETTNQPHPIDFENNSSPSYRGGPGKGERIEASIRAIHEECQNVVDDILQSELAEDILAVT